jgi:hypothetical protein
LPRIFFASRKAVRSEKLSRTIETPRTASGNQALSSSCGSLSFEKPSKIENIPPMLNSTIETMNA